MERDYTFNDLQQKFIELSSPKYYDEMMDSGLSAHTHMVKKWSDALGITDNDIENIIIEIFDELEQLLGKKVVNKLALAMSGQSYSKLDIIGNLKVILELIREYRKELGNLEEGDKLPEKLL
jgi:hypothetical protein